MGLVIFCLTILLTYGIINAAYKKFKSLQIEEKMEDIETTEEDAEKILAFKKKHKGDINKKRKIIKDFKKE